MHRTRQAGVCLDQEALCRLNRFRRGTRQPLSRVVNTIVHDFFDTLCTEPRSFRRGNRSSWRREAEMRNDPRIIRCCDQPPLRLTRDERVTRLATLTGEGVLLVDDTPVSGRGATFDDDDKHLACDTCDMGQELADD